ncbi:Gametoproteintin-binding protein 2 [Phytophthora boehmeriae]|uniref:Gametoproteintin-binding protein 2 n=1 Tax=Phytophthora boehmeriae TaxID=109152 RepID=A0A8T1XEE8_9STRA|nr:Gametoproteintin-binding protein 2 [Phytophthora boehmeriae]
MEEDSKDGSSELSLGDDQERAFRASRLSGNRSIEVALAEIQIIEHNVYVQRKERSLPADEVTRCSCKLPTGEGELGCLDGCLNRAALIECIPGFCKCGDRCDNQRIQRGTMPATQLFDCGGKGLGLKLLEDIKAGSFVGEYMGEIVTEQEYYMRRVLYHNEKHRYMMVLSGGEVIDATRMGGRARFINHSCSPNCGVEKWDINGEERCGIFALRDIFAGEELTFDYKFESFSKAEITECLCGAPNCRQVIGMNNRVAKPIVQKKTSVASAPAQKQPKTFDPIVGRSARPVQGTKKAEALMQRMARQRLLSSTDMRILRRSHVMLERNLSWHMDDDFQHLALLPYFITKTSTKHAPELKHVPDFFNWRDLPGFPLKIRNAIELMAMAGCDREPSPDASSKLPNSSAEKPRGCGPNSSCQCQPSAAETREFRKRWLLLTDRERVTALRGDASQFLQTAIDLLPCPGCRNSAEALFYKLVDGAVRVPQIVSRAGLCFDKDSHFRLNESYLNSPDTSFSLFFHQERWATTALIKAGKPNTKAGTSRARCQLHSQRVRARPRPDAFEALWHKLPEDHQRHLAHIDSDQFLTDLESYLRRHRFCCRCKEKVLEAYDLLIGSSCSEDDCEDCGNFECGDKHHEHSDYGDDLNYTSYLFDELAFSRATNQIIVPCNIDFMSQLMSRADQEVVGDWGDRHARTIAEAQDEVLICLGMVIWEKMQNLWTKSRSEKRAEELLVHCAVFTLRRNFDVAVEALHGEEMMEQLLAEEDDETRRLEKKKEKRKEKKKKRKSASKQKQADRSESEKSQQADAKPKSKQDKARKHSDSKTVETSPSSTNSLSSQGDDDDYINSNGSDHQLEDHQCDLTCDEPCLRGNLTFDERVEWQLLSSMGWDASNQFASSLPELDVDTDDENHGIPEDEIRFWKQNRPSLVRRRMAQRQKLQERFDQFVLRTTSLDA